MIPGVTKMRNKKGWSQSKLARESTVSRATIWRLEKMPGKVEVKTGTLDKLAVALGCHVGDFF